MILHKSWEIVVMNKLHLISNWYAENANAKQTESLTCASSLVPVEFESFVTVTGEDARCADADLFTVMFPLSTEVNG